jgi:hypothetical protein
MDDLHEFCCPSCNSPDIVRIQTNAIYDELIECGSCGGIFPMEYVGGAAEPSAGLIEGSRQPKHSRRGSL